METECIIFQCLKCKKFQGKRTENFGRKTKKAKCNYCGTMADLIKTGKRVKNDGTIPDRIRALNSPAGYTGFKTFSKKEE